MRKRHCSGWSKTNGVWLPAQIHPHLLLWAKPPSPPSIPCNSNHHRLIIASYERKVYHIFGKYGVVSEVAMMSFYKWYTVLADSVQFGNLVKKFHISDSGTKNPLQRELFPATNKSAPLPDNLILGQTPPCPPSPTPIRPSTLLTPITPLHPTFYPHKTWWMQAPSSYDLWRYFSFNSLPLSHHVGNLNSL